MTKTIILILAVALAAVMHGTTCTSRASGGWHAITTWDLGRVPACGDSVIIKPGHTVQLSSSIAPKCRRMSVTVLGVLHLTGKSNMELPCGSNVYLLYGGMLTSDRSGSRLAVCGTTYWADSTGNMTGPECMPPVSWCGKVLSVEMADVNAVKHGTQVSIKWCTNSERNNAHFCLQKTSDGGKTWTNVKTIKSAGEGDGCREYEVVDHSKGASHYRLCQVDKDGFMTCHRIAYVDGVTTRITSLYPNQTGPNVRATRSGWLLIADFAGETVFYGYVSGWETLKLRPGVYISVLDDIIGKVTVKGDEHIKTEIKK